MGPRLAKANLPERRCSKRQARRHSAMIRWMRIGLPVVVVGIASSYVVMATPRTIDQSFVDQFENLDVATEDMRMERPRFVGEDNQGQSFEILADAAQQNPETPELIALENPEAFQQIREMGEEYIRALNGVYSTSERTIDLRNNVRIRQGIGSDDFDLTTEVGKIALDDRTFTSDVKVFGESSQGTISAEGMTAYQEDNRVVFRNAHMRYNAGRKTGQEAAAQPDAAQEGEDGQAAETRDTAPDRAEDQDG